MRNLRSLCQEPHRLHETKLLPPFAECHANVFLKEPLYSPLARACSLADPRERTAVTRVGQEDFGHAECSWVRWIGQLQWNRSNDFQLVQNHEDQMTLPLDSLLQSAKGAGVENKFLQQRRDVDYAAAASRQRPRKARSEVQRSHRHRTSAGIQTAR
jgi:hypothetical protein